MDLLGIAVAEYWTDLPPKAVLETMINGIFETKINGRSTGVVGTYEIPAENRREENRLFLGS